MQTNCLRVWRKLATSHVFTRLSGDRTAQWETTGIQGLRIGHKKSISVKSAECRRGRPPGPLHSVFHRDRHCAAHGRSCSARRGCMCLQREQPEVRVWQTAGRWHSRESSGCFPTSRGCSQLQQGYLVFRHRYLTKKKEMRYIVKTEHDPRPLPSRTAKSLRHQAGTGFLGTRVLCGL